MKNFLFVFFCFSFAVMTNVSHSAEDIFFEMSSKDCLSCVEDSFAAEYDELSNVYISRGEDLLLAGKFEDSIEDLQAGYEMTSYGFKKNKDVNRMRSLFGMLIAYAHLEKVDRVQEVSEKMISIMDSRPCSNYKRELASTSNECRQLNGPVSIPIRDCVDRVVGTKRAAMVFAVAIPRKEVRALTVLAIEDLADRAERCCYAGGLWKGCLIPLLNKWYAVQSSPIWYCY